MEPQRGFSPYMKIGPSTAEEYNAIPCPFSIGHEIKLFANGSLRLSKIDNK